MRVTQSEITSAHEDSRTEDELRRKMNRSLRLEWEAKGGPAAEEKHFDWLRIRPLVKNG